MSESIIATSVLMKLVVVIVLVMKGANGQQSLSVPANLNVTWQNIGNKTVFNASLTGQPASSTGFWLSVGLNTVNTMVYQICYVLCIMFLIIQIICKQNQRVIAKITERN
jgi:hypothetical protein